MLEIESFNHVGIRISERGRAVTFYERLGFELVTDTGFSEGHPIVMRSSRGIVLNLLGPATAGAGSNILMDTDDKYPGVTHFALTVSSLAATRRFLDEIGVPITGSFSFGDMSAVFIRDPDRNVIELDSYGENTPEGGSYSGHPA